MWNLDEIVISSFFSFVSANTSFIQMQCNYFDAIMLDEEEIFNLQFREQFEDDKIGKHNFARDNKP